MEFSLNYLREVLPPSDPPAEFVPAAVRDAFPESGTEGDENRLLIRRSAVWTYAIFSEVRGGYYEASTRWGPYFWWPSPWEKFPRPHPLYPLWRELSVGVLDRQYEGSGFGLIVAVPFALESAILGDIAFPRLGRSFPIAVRAVIEDLHVVPCATNATSACWAEDQQNIGTWGFLTCRHAMSGLARGATVPLNGGGTGTLERRAPVAIDAAFVSISPPAGQLSPLRLVTFPTSGQSVNVLVLSGSVPRSIVSVTDTLGIINDRHHPIKVYLDQSCQPGDSGALVQMLTGEGVAIYCGEMTGATVAGQTGQTVGFAQHLEQATAVLNLSPYI